MKRILVTGATGNVGREVTRALNAQGFEVRACYSGSSAPAGIADTVACDFRDRATWGPALEGIEGLFLLRPPPISDVETTLNPFFDLALQSGVKHTVFLSVMGAGTNKLVPHHAVEKHLLASGASVTILRPGFFAQNLADAYRRDILEDDRLYVPAGAGRAAFVDLRDVADLTALCFVSPENHRTAHLLTGPRAFSFEEGAALLTETLGRPIHYRPASVPGYLLHLRRRGLRPTHLLVQTILHVGLRFGQAERVDGTLERLLGRPTHDLASYVRDHRELWMK